MKVIIVPHFNFVRVIPRFVLSSQHTALFPLSMMLTLIPFIIVIFFSCLLLLLLLALMCLNRKWKIVTNRNEKKKKRKDGLSLNSIVFQLMLLLCPGSENLVLSLAMFIAMTIYFCIIIWYHACIVCVRLLRNDDSVWKAVAFFVYIQDILLMPNHVYEISQSMNQCYVNTFALNQCIFDFEHKTNKFISLNDNSSDRYLSAQRCWKTSFRIPNNFLQYVFHFHLNAHEQKKREKIESNSTLSI